MLLRARIVLPVSRPPIEDGAVLISGNRIVAVEPWRELAPHVTESPIDLGPVIVLPGLVNAHCHLDYTDMAGLPAPEKFSDWIQSLLVLKASFSYSDYAESWLRGARLLAQTGTTTVADIEAVPELLPEVWRATPLRVCSFLEMTGVKTRRNAQAILKEAADKIAALRPERGFVGLSPHALYSTMPDLLRRAARYARKKNLRLTMHVAESAEEFEMYAHGRGALFQWLKGQRDMSDCGDATPVQQLRRYGLLDENFLAVHANYLGPGDAQLLSEAGASVVHCPRSHAYFRHAPFACRELSAAGVNVCLGTDSLASVTKVRGRKPELNLFAEMRQFSLVNPEVAPAAILEMATLRGACALGLQGLAGELCENAFADLIAVPFVETAADAESAVVNNTQALAASMIDGQWLARPED